MAKKYNIDEVRLMGTIPGSLKRTLRKDEKIFIDIKDQIGIEELLKQADVGFSSFNYSFNVVMLVIH